MTGISFSRQPETRIRHLVTLLISCVRQPDERYAGTSEIFSWTTSGRLMCRPPLVYTLIESFASVNIVALIVKSRLSSMASGVP
ncbi:hypothetical protein TNCV_591981 [Trichonephila clavipes]|nr:hypothetical protein TNCV_591981 [Trichonephila clavipes]